MNAKSCTSKDTAQKIQIVNKTIRRNDNFRYHPYVKMVSYKHTCERSYMTPIEVTQTTFFILFLILRRNISEVCTGPRVHVTLITESPIYI